MEKIIYSIIGLAVLGGVVLLFMAPSKPGELDSFAQCIADRGAIFWGAFWCPHCNDQKALFGRSAKLLPYKECSTPDGRGQTAECTEAGITGYPAWDIPGQERISGLIELSRLSELTSCPLPEATQ